MNPTADLDARRLGARKMNAWLRAFINTPAFLERYPYYAFVLAKLHPIEATATQAMAVSSHGREFCLHVNVDYFSEHPEYLKGVLLHEVHHIVLGHLTAAKFQGVAHPDLMRLAMEMSANEFIQEPLPEGCVTWQAHRQFGIRAGQSTVERYDRLVAARRQGFLVATGGALVGDCGSMLGNNKNPHPLAVSEVRRLVEQAKRLLDRIAKRVEDGSSPKFLLAGRDPGALIEELKDTNRPPQTYMDWKAAIRMFVSQTRRRVYTLRYPSRRAPDRLGQVPGRRRARRPDEQPSILAAVDTSGSMNDVELNEIARQLVPLSRVAKITVVECDATIQRVYRFTGSIGEFRGRGGTNFSPVFAPEFLRQHRPDGVVYFTDGNGVFPREEPPVRTLWVLTQPGSFACPWGKRAWLRLDSTSNGAFVRR